VTGSVYAAMVKVAGTISKSSEVMKIVNEMSKVGAMQSGMRDLAKGASTPL
jgi:hypothetical protein